MFGKNKKSKFKPGLICVPASEMGRYTQFNFCLAQLEKPEGSMTDWQIGHQIADNINKSIKLAIEMGYHWVWILDDDSIFDPGMLLRLLEHDKPVVCPFILERMSPYRPTLRKPLEDRFIQVGMEYFSGKNGLINISGLCLGTAGMLIQIDVLKNMEQPWMEHKHKVCIDFDLHFCEKLADNSVELYLDLDNPLGHMTHIQVLPHQLEGGNWTSVYQTFNPLMYYDNVKVGDKKNGK